MQLSRQQRRTGSKDRHSRACWKQGIPARVHRPFRGFNLQALEEAVRQAKQLDGSGQQTAGNQQEQQEQQQDISNQSVPVISGNLPEQQPSMLSISSVTIPACTMEGGRRQRGGQARRRQGSGRRSHLRSFALHALIPEPPLPPVLEPFAEAEQENIQPELPVTAADSPVPVLPAAALIACTTPGNKPAGMPILSRLSSPLTSTGATTTSTRLRRWLQGTPMEGVPERLQLLPPHSAMPTRSSPRTTQKPGSHTTYQWLTPVEGIMERQLLAGFLQAASTPVPTPRPNPTPGPTHTLTPAPSTACTPMEGVPERPILLNTVLAAARMHALRGSGSWSTGASGSHSGQLAGAFPTSAVPDGAPCPTSYEPCSDGASNTIRPLLPTAGGFSPLLPAPSVVQAAPAGTLQLTLPQPASTFHGLGLMQQSMDASPAADGPSSVPSQLRLTLAQLSPGRADWEQVDPRQEDPQAGSPRQVSVLTTGTQRRAARQEVQVQTSVGLALRATSRTAGVPAAAGPCWPTGTFTATVGTPLEGVSNEPILGAQSARQRGMTALTAARMSVLAQRSPQEQLSQHGVDVAGMAQEYPAASPLPSSINSTPAYMRRLSAPPSTVPSPALLAPAAGLDPASTPAAVQAASEHAHNTGAAAAQPQNGSRNGLQADQARSAVVAAAPAALLPHTAPNSTELQELDAARPQGAGMASAAVDEMGYGDDAEDDGVADDGGYGSEDDDEMGPPGGLLDAVDLQLHGPGSYGNDAQDELEEGGHMRAAVPSARRATTRLASSDSEDEQEEQQRSHGGSSKAARNTDANARAEQSTGQHASKALGKHSRDTDAKEGGNDLKSDAERKLRRKSLAGAGMVTGADGCRRSSRSHIRPLEYWRNEHKLYAREHRTMPTVVGIETRTPNPQWPMLSTGHVVKRSKARTKAGNAVAAEQPEQQHRAGYGKRGKAHAPREDK